jgi:hypothetical protein
VVERKRLDHVPLILVTTEQWVGRRRFNQLATRRHMAKSRKHPLEDNPFAEGFFEWMDSTDGQEHIAMLDALWPLLQDVKLDAGQRIFVWPDGKRLNFEKSAKRLQEQTSDFKLEEVKEFLIDWIDGYAPSGITQEELDEFDSLASAWTGELRK